MHWLAHSRLLQIIVVISLVLFVLFASRRLRSRPRPWNAAQAAISVDASGVVRWKANVPICVFVTENGRNEVLLAEAHEGVAQPDWINSGNVYGFLVRQTADAKLMASVEVTKDEHGRLVPVARSRWQKIGLPVVALLLAAGLLLFGMWPAVRTGLARLPLLGRLDPYPVFLVAAEIALFSISFSSYFFGDSISQLLVRPTTVQELLHAFVSIGDWYRPIPHTLLPYLLWPLFGNHFAPYHAVALLLHAAVSVVVYRACVRILNDRQGAFAGAFFFALHPVNFYTTYDNAFFSDTTLALFYILAVWSFLTRRFTLATVLTALALLSKEAAVTLPLVLLTAVLAIPGLRREWRGWLKHWLPIGGVWLAYLAFYGYGRLHAHGRVDYVLSVFEVPRGLLRFLVWAAQMRYGIGAANWYCEPPLSWLLPALAISIALLALAAVIRGNLPVRAGLLWFAITAIPMAALGREFPHHLYLPLVGIGLALGQAFAYLGARLPRPLTAVLAVTVCFGHAWLSYINTEVDQRLSWVGGSALAARNAVAYVHDHAGQIHNQSIIYIVTETPDLLQFDYAGGELFRFSTGLDNLQVDIIPKARVPLPLRRDALVASYVDKCLIDSTAEFIGSGSRLPAHGVISISGDGLLSWQADGDVMVFVTVDGGAQKLMARHASGATKPAFLTAGHTYCFSLREAKEDGGGELLDVSCYRKSQSGEVRVGKQP